MSSNKVLIRQKNYSVGPGNFKLGIESASGHVEYIDVNSSIQEFFTEKSIFCFIKKEIEEDRVVVSNEFFGDSMKIPNAYRYIVKRIASEIVMYEFPGPDSMNCKSKFSDLDLAVDSDLKSIVLILESPHIDEYDYSCGVPTSIGPAQGMTGLNILNKLITLFKTYEVLSNYLDNNQEYRVIIYNPIPFQTSLHFFHRHKIKSAYKTLRNNVWKTLWKMDESFKSNLIHCLKNLKDGSLILNCCSSSLNQKVSEAIITPPNKIEHFILNHPSIWHQNFNLRTEMKAPNTT